MYPHIIGRKNNLQDIWNDHQHHQDVRFKHSLFAPSQQGLSYPSLRRVEFKFNTLSIIIITNALATLDWNDKPNVGYAESRPPTVTRPLPLLGVSDASAIVVPLLVVLRFSSHTT